jgi:uncharacterized protein
MIGSMQVVALTVCLFLAAALFSSVGNAGASGYLAAMSLFGLPTEEMRPAALALNIIAASIGTARFLRAGCFSWRIFFWPFALASIPAAFVSGLYDVPGTVFRPLVACALLIATVGMVAKTRPANARTPSFFVSLFCGGIIGLLSGLSGTGGGIFLSPLLLLAGWADPRQAAGISAAFVLLNSTVSLAGVLIENGRLPTPSPLWLLAVAVGAIVGSELGSRRLGGTALRWSLAAVMAVAAAKLLVAP